MPHELPGSDLASASDADLLELSKQGSSAAFGELWARHAAAGRTVARSFTSSLDPDDLVAEAFTKIFQLLLKGKGPTGAFRPYLFTAIRNTAASWGRARRETSIDTLESFEDPASSEESSLAALDNGLTASAFRALPTRWQEVLWYSEVESMTPAQIAPLLGMSANSVAALSYRAREGLRQAWIGAHLKSENLSDECRWSIEHLGGYTRDGLGKRDTARLEKHLDACAKCTIAASEAEEVGSRLALVLLPLAAGIGGSTAYTHWLQTGGPETALAAGPMPLGVTAGGAGASAAGGTVSGTAAGTFAASGAGTGVGVGAGIALPTTTLIGGFTAITAASIVAGFALAASVAVAIVLGLNPVLTESPGEQLAAEQEAAAPATPPADPANPAVDTPVVTPPAVVTPVDTPPANPPAVVQPGVEPAVVDPPVVVPPVVDPPAPPLAAPAVTGLDTGGGALFPHVEGTAEPGATIEFTADGVPPVPTAAARFAGTFAPLAAAGARSTWSVTADALGEWSATLSGLAPGEYRLSSRQITVAGDASPAVSSEPFTLAAAPMVAGLADSSHHLGALSSLTFAGLSGAALEFSVDAGALWTSASLDAAGNTTASLAPIPVGQAGLHARYTGDGGRVGPTSVTAFSIVPIPVPSFSVDTSGGLHFPRFSGSDALPGSDSARLDVFLGNTVHATALADARGSWSATVTDIAPGLHTPCLAQRIGDSRSPRVAGAPFLLAEPPLLLDMTDGAEYRADEQPSLFFQGVPSAGVEYSLDGGESWSTTRVEEDAYGFVELAPFDVGQVSVSIRYGSGGRFGPSSTVDFTILPMVAPAVPTVTVDTGDGYFFPLVSGIGTEPSFKTTTMELFVDGVSRASVTTYASNPWSTIVDDLPVGTHELAVIAHGQNGLSSDPSTAIEFTVKAAPEFEAGYDGTATRIDKNVYIDIFGVPGKTVRGSLNGSSSGGIYLLPASGQAEIGYGGLPPGRYTTEIRYTDQNDLRRFGPSSSTWFVVTPIPALPAPTVDTGDGRYFPVISGTGALPAESYSILTEVAVDGIAQPKLAADALGSWATTVTGLAPGTHTATATQWSGGLTSDTSPAADFTLLAPPALQPGLGGSDHAQHAVPPLDFTGVPNSDFEYSSDGGSVWTTATLDGSGQASATLSTQPVGPVTIDARYADGAGRVGPASVTAFTVSAPPTPSFAVDTGGDRYFPIVSGTDAIPGARIDVRLDGGAALGGVVADALGVWSTTLSALAPGTYSVAVGQSIAGADSAVGPPTAFSVLAPPALTAPLAGSSHREDQLPNLEFSGAPNAGFQYSADAGASWVSASFDGSGQQIANPLAVPAGQATIQLRYSDGAGRYGPKSDTAFTVTALPAPTATIDTAGGRYLPTVSGIDAVGGASIDVTVDGLTTQSTLADGTGAWSLTAIVDTAGDHTLTFRQTSNGVTSATSPPATFTLLPAPTLAAGLDGSSHQLGTLTQLAFSGLPGERVEHFVHTVTSWTGAVLDGAGQVTVGIPPLPIGEATIGARYGDGNGRHGVVTLGTVSIVPAPPTFTVDTADGLYFPIIAGTDAEPGADVELRLNGVAQPPITADGNGDWSVTVDDVQANVLYQVTASQHLGASTSALSSASSFQLKAPQILSPANNSTHSSWNPITVQLSGQADAFIAGTLSTNSMDGSPMDGQLLTLNGAGVGSVSFNNVGSTWTTGQIEVRYSTSDGGSRNGVPTTITVNGN